MMIAQPILAGPDGSERNVVRITTLCYPILVIFIFNIFDFKKLLTKNFGIYLFNWTTPLVFASYFFKCKNI